jgi:hypothetical protein
MRDAGLPASGMARWRWRLRGASMWPTFALCVAGETALLKGLPAWGGAADVPDALLTAGFHNSAVVATVAPAAGALLRRRRRDLPRVVARDHAGTVALLLVFCALAGAGVLNRPAVDTAQRSLRAQAQALRRYVEHSAAAVYRRHVGRADSVALDENLFRSCVPGVTTAVALCLFIDTSHSPPSVRLDSDRAPNALYFNHQPGDYSDSP